MIRTVQKLMDVAMDANVEHRGSDGSVERFQCEIRESDGAKYVTITTDRFSGNYDGSYETNCWSYLAWNGLNEWYRFDANGYMLTGCIISIWFLTEHGEHCM